MTEKMRNSGGTCHLSGPVPAPALLLLPLPALGNECDVDITLPDFSPALPRPAFLCCCCYCCLVRWPRPPAFLRSLSVFFPGLCRGNGGSRTEATWPRKLRTGVIRGPALSTGDRS